MELTVEEVPGSTPVTVLAIRGKLDASNYEQVIARGHELVAAGTRHVLLDLEELTFMGSSGLVALHSLTLLLRGEPTPGPNAGWSALRAVEHALADEPQPYLKLLRPQPRIAQMLAVTGMDRYFQVFSDREAALASFTR